MAPAPGPRRPAGADRPAPGNGSARLELADRRAGRPARARGARRDRGPAPGRLESPRVRYADPAAGRLLGPLLAAVLCLLAGSLVTFALGGPGWFGGLLSFALFMTAAAVANVSHGRIAATINGRL